MIEKEDLNANLHELQNLDAQDPRKTNLDENIDDSMRTEPKEKRVVKKRQCANCTCSRSKNKQVQNEDGSIIKPKGGCGSCALGDAYRCKGCPYKGMPAFKEGEAFTFTDDLNDI